MSKGRRMLLLALALAVFVTPAIVFAGDRFNDVPDTNVFHDDIGWLADAGVTLGCNPPTNDEFCPSSDVKREQMAAFMRRFAKFLGAEDGIVSEADHAATADSAADADLLGGLPPDAYSTFVVASTDSPFLALVGVTEVLTATVSPTMASYAALNATIGLEYIGVDIFADVSGWLEVDDTSCDGIDTATPAFLATVAADGTEPLLATLSITGGVELTPGDHTVTVCASGVDASANTVGLNAIVSPSELSEIVSPVSVIEATPLER